MDFRLKKALQIIMPALTLASGVRAAKADGGEQPSSYAKDAAAQEAHLNAWFRAHPGGPLNRAVVISPDEVDMATSIAGLSAAADAVKRILARQGVTVSDYRLARIADDVQERTVLKDGSTIISTNPSQTPSAPDSPISIVVPIQDDTMRLDRNGDLVRNVGAETASRFFNGHERWHARDPSKTPKSPMKALFLWATEPGVSADLVKSVVEKPDWLAKVAASYRSEAFADVSEAGEMVRREKKPLAFIDTVATHLRENHMTTRETPEHFTSDALSALKDRIQDMGLKKFRAMDDGKMTRFYNSVVEGNGLASPEGMRAFLLYAYGEPREKPALDAAKDPNIQLAVAAAKRTLAHTAAPADAKSDLMQDIKGWNPLQTLRDRALAESGQLGAPGLINAYQNMQEELRTQIKAEPKNTFYVEAAVRLRSAFADAGVRKILQGAVSPTTAPPPAGLRFPLPPRRQPPASSSHK